MTFKPTDEQMAILDAARAGDHLVIEAGAGTGKTSTLKLLAEEQRGKRGVYLAYNKAIQMEAKSKFPRNVDCRTAHSMAYRAVGVRFAERLKAPRQPASHVARILGIRKAVQIGPQQLLQPRDIARLTIETVANFCRSAGPTIRLQHVPRLNGIDDRQHAYIQRGVLPLAELAWQNLQVDDNQWFFNPSDPGSYSRAIKMSHDVYLKMWQLTNPKIGADVIYFDEAQDADPVIASIVKAQQQHAQLIAVGDANQQLYAWRGAVDALADWPGDQRLYLSQSWRFGPEVAAEANKWLKLLDSRLRLKGAPNMRSVVAPMTDWPDAVLCRTNATCVAEAMKAMAANRRTAIVGGGQHIRDLAEACLDLKDGRPTSHPELCLFSSWAEVQDFVDNEQGGSDLKTFVDLVDDIGPEAVIEAMDNLVDEKHKPELVVSTGHKSKGLEWPRVTIGEDFRDPGMDDNGGLRPVPRPDMMLNYVVVTRAREHLDRGNLSYVDERLSTGRLGMAALRS